MEEIKTDNSVKPRNSKWAIWSLVLGIAGVVLFCIVIPSILAIIFGIIALVQISKNQGVLFGKGKAITGIILGGLEIIVIIAAIVILSLLNTKEAAMEAKARSKMMNISTCLEMYHADYGVYPTTEQGLQALVKNAQGHLYMSKIPNASWDQPYLDSWDQPYRYCYPGVNNPSLYDLWSDGKDGIKGTSDDLTNWNK
jgi:general secretion pathway protein G